jgi:two-component system KDP operon response regulator KdpE
MKWGLLSKGKGKTVLVVDDSPPIRGFLKASLEAENFTVREAGNGEDALASLNQGWPDLVVLDLGLPDMDGLDVIARLRDMGHAMPILVLTVRDDMKTRIQALRNGATAYISKPFRIGELMEAIAKALG